jgi:hypothetical protein
MNIYHQEIPRNIPYTYHLIWLDPITELPAMKYYGVRYAKNCYPNDLWVSYFTSSRYVTEYVKKFGNPNVIEIRRVFTDNDRIQQAINWEKKVLVRIKAHIRNDYINKHTGAAINYNDPEVIARREYVNSLDITKQNRKDAAIRRESDESIKQKRIKACNTPEAKEKRNKTRIQNFDKSPEAKITRSTRSKEINNRPEILEANRKRYLGVTWEERIGEEAAREYKAKMASVFQKYRDDNPNRVHPNKGKKTGRNELLSGKKHYGYDHTLYCWIHKETGEELLLTRQDFEILTGAKKSNVYKLVKGYCKSVKGYYIKSQ